MAKIAKDSSRDCGEIRRVTLIGVAANLGLAGFKITAGIVGASQVVVADGVHSLSDLSTDAALLVGMKYWSAPADESHPHGHRRIETVTTVFIGLVLAAAALGLGFNALVTFNSPHAKAPGMIALIAALVSIAVKESLYRWTLRVGTNIRSPAVIANAWHHRSDALSSIPAALAVAGARIAPAWYFLDHVGAMLVSIFILSAAWRIGWTALCELTDAGGGAQAHARIEDICLAVPGVLSVHKCRTRRLGFGLQADIHVQVAADISVREGHAVTGAVKSALLKNGPEIVDVLTHLEPHEDFPPNT